MIKISSENIKLLHQLTAEATGGSVGVRDEGLLDSAVEVTIAATHTTSSSADQVTYSSSSGATITNGTVDLTAEQTAAQPVATATIINNAGSVLPSTGGIGTTIFYIVGAILVLGAGILLVTRRRMNAN